jgi:hypothetical protein
MKPMTEQDPSVKLLTILNVASAQPSKRQRSSARDWHSIARKVARTTSNSVASSSSQKGKEVALAQGLAAVADEDSEEEDETAKKDSYERHWASDTALVKNKSAEELAESKWKKTRKTLPGLGEVTELSLEDTPEEAAESSSIVSLHSSFYGEGG